MSEALFNFKEFTNANAPKLVSSIDYLHAIYTCGQLPQDFILSTASLFWPKFKVVDDVVFISDLFDEQTYKNYRGEGKQNEEIQFWMNLLEITSLFDGLDTGQAVIVGQSLAHCWNAKIRTEPNMSSLIAETIHDDETNEVFITMRNSNFNTKEVNK